MNRDDDSSSTPTETIFNSWVSSDPLINKEETVTKTSHDNQRWWKEYKQFGQKKK